MCVSVLRTTCSSCASGSVPAFFFFLFILCMASPLNVNRGSAFPLLPAFFSVRLFCAHIVPSLHLPRLNLVRAAVHSKKRSEAFLLIPSITTWQPSIHALPRPPTDVHFVLFKQRAMLRFLADFIASENQEDYCKPDKYNKVCTCAASMKLNTQWVLSFYGYGVLGWIRLLRSCSKNDIFPQERLSVCQQDLWGNISFQTSVSGW